MAQVKVRSRHQITIPARIAESANIKKDDVLEITCKNGVLTLKPVSGAATKKSAISYAGIARGVWGNTVQEIEAELEEHRDSWER